MNEDITCPVEIVLAVALDSQEKYKFGGGVCQGGRK